ncbi:hypothetical protein KSF_000040 [Reticulibacter mediterranei]|uniref:DUF3841 domain-containing protein n=1 Tax=Reticulibacter mediterranei TaxID=2778369 RepID=A0A8J3IGR9_9CHLR|nr:DUF3841 domain-containing protein [Reticulibacter mediterranei]GHO89956.1 hypothetical protein KSF_000040 [Reticulibacter mediterranei]
MKVWTVQPEWIWHQLQWDGVLSGPQASEIEGAEFLTAYDWIVAQMEQCLGPPPQAGRYPLWVWHQWQNAKQRRPDLQHAGHMTRGMRGVRLECDIDERDLLLSRFDMWHAVLNNGYLSVDEEDHTAFDAACESRGCDEAVSQFRKRITSSWERVFDLDRVFPDQWYAPRADSGIQGTFWVLHLEQVYTVKTFTSR